MSARKDTSEIHKGHKRDVNWFQVVANKLRFGWSVYKVQKSEIKFERYKYISHCEGA